MVRVAHSQRVGVAGSFGFLYGARTYSFQHNASIESIGVSLYSGWSVTAVRSYTHTPSTFTITGDGDYNAVLSELQATHYASTFLGSVSFYTATESAVQTRLLSPSILPASASLYTISLKLTGTHTASQAAGTVALNASTVGQGQGVSVIAGAGTVALNTIAAVTLAPNHSASRWSATTSLQTATVSASRISGETVSQSAGSVSMGTFNLKRSGSFAATIFEVAASLLTATEAATKAYTATPAIMAVTARQYAIAVTATTITTAPVLSPNPTVAQSAGTVSLGVWTVAAHISGGHTPATFEISASYNAATPALQWSYSATSWPITCEPQVSAIQCSSIFVIDPNENSYYSATIDNIGVSMMTASILVGSVQNPDIMEIAAGVPTHAYSVAEVPE